MNREYRKPLVNGDVLSLLAIGLQITFVLGFVKASIGNRGWPYWLRKMFPDWLGPFEVLFSLPSLALLLSAIALVVVERQIHRFRSSSSLLPRVCFVALKGNVVSAGIMSIIALISLRNMDRLSLEYLLCGYGILFLIFLVCTLFSVIIVRTPLRNNYRRKEGLCLICGYRWPLKSTGVCLECGEAMAEIDSSSTSSMRSTCKCDGE